MRERNLRRIALESGKTTSKKANTKALSSKTPSYQSSADNSPVVSPHNSPGGSRIGSRNPSRHGSDEDDEHDSDDFASSVASLDINDMSDGNELEKYEHATADTLRSDLAAVIQRIMESTHGKSVSSEARTLNIRTFANILCVQHMANAQLDEVVPALFKSIRSGSTELERILALKALAITVITSGEELFTESYETLRRCIQDGNFHAAQAAAIRTLGAVTFFGGADISDTEEVMDLFLDIIESDGESIAAKDNPLVVATALQEWGFLATEFDTLEDNTERPLQAFDDQLESTDLRVQTAAATNIALIYENSYRQLEAGEEADTFKADDHEYRPFKRELWTKRYDVAHDNHLAYSLASRLGEIARSPARHLAKEKRKELHATARDVLNTVENPYRGPKYSTALDEDQLYYLGHRYTVRFSDWKSGGAEYLIDRWWKLSRYEAIKRSIGAGFRAHFSNNDFVRSMLPKGLDATTDF